MAAPPFLRIQHKDRFSCCNQEKCWFVSSYGFLYSGKVTLVLEVVEQCFCADFEYGSLTVLTWITGILGSSVFWKQTCLHSHGTLAVSGCMVTSNFLGLNFLFYKMEIIDHTWWSCEYIRKYARDGFGYSKHSVKKLFLYPFLIRIE